MPARSSARYIATPTMEPAVPGAIGMKPAPAAVATTIASQSAELIGSLFVFTISVGLVNFFRGTLGCRDAIFAAGPPAKVNQLAALAAKRPVRVAGILDFFFAGWAFHERYKFPSSQRRGMVQVKILPMRSYSRLPVISTL